MLMLIRRMLLLLFLSSLSLTIITAQEQTPQYVIDAAKNATNAQIPGLGNPNNWQHRLIHNVGDSALGCSLASGVALPSTISVYIVTLDYSGVQYTIHVAADASVVQICDTKFPDMGSDTGETTDDIPIDPNADADGDGINNNDDSCPYIAGKANEIIFNGCPQPSEGDADGDNVGDGEDACISQPGPPSNNGCSTFPDSDGDIVPDIVDVCPNDVGAFLVDGFPQGCPIDGSGNSPTPRQPGEQCLAMPDDETLIYENPATTFTTTGTLTGANAVPTEGSVIGRTGDSTWYQVASGWVQAVNVGLIGACYNIPVTDGSAGQPDASSCELQAADTLANVRNGPSLDNPQVGTIFPNETYTVQGHNGDRTWFFFNKGWVAAQVVNLLGDCQEAAYVNPLFAGSGSVNFCPPYYEGYMPPRIQTGVATAQLQLGGAPNRLRSEPSTAGAILGEIQPGRTLNAVLDGPACGEGFVWWLVEIDDAVGWTAESNVTTDEYYIDPTSGNEFEAITRGTTGSGSTEQPAPGGTVGTTDQAMSGTDAGNIVARSTTPFVVANESPTDLAWLPDGSKLAVISVRTLALYNYPDLQPTIIPLVGSETTELLSIATSADGQYLAVGGRNGNIWIVSFDGSSNTTVTPLPQEHTNPVLALDFNTNGTVLASVSGDQAGNDWTLKLWDFSQMFVGGDFVPVLNYSFPYALIDVAFSADDRYLAVVGEDPPSQAGGLWVYDTTSYDLLYSAGMPFVQGLVFVAPAPLTAPADFVFGNGGSADTFTVATQITTRLVSMPGETTDGIVVSNVAIQSENASSPLLAVSMQMASEFTGQETVSFYDFSQPNTPGSPQFMAVQDMAFHPDGTTFAMLGVDGRIYLLGAGTP